MRLTEGKRLKVLIKWISNDRSEAAVSFFLLSTRRTCQKQNDRKSLTWLAVTTTGNLVWVLCSRDVSVCSGVGLTFPERSPQLSPLN